MASPPGPRYKSREVKSTGSCHNVGTPEFIAGFFSSCLGPAETSNGETTITNCVNIVINNLSLTICESFFYSVNKPAVRGRLNHGTKWLRQVQRFLQNHAEEFRQPLFCGWKTSPVRTGTLTSFSLPNISYSGHCNHRSFIITAGFDSKTSETRNIVTILRIEFRIIITSISSLLYVFYTRLCLANVMKSKKLKAAIDVNNFPADCRYLAPPFDLISETHR
jgi:hypothetical protein